MEHKINLTPEQYNLLNKEIKGEGGFQSLQRKLLSQLNGLSLILYPEDIERICRYIKKYGNGGAQKQFFEIFKRHLQCL